MRHTHEWTDAELDYLAQHYALRGTAFIRARYPHISVDSARQMATRLSLADDLREYRPLREIAKEAGVTPQSVRDWLSSRPWASKHVRTWGRDTLLPTPVERLYLSEQRRSSRPRGWLTSPQVAQRLNVSAVTVRQMCSENALTCALVRGVVYVDPQDLPAPRQTTPPPNAVTLAALASVAGEHLTTLHRSKAIRVIGTVHRPAGGRPGRYTTADHARQFLTARGHHAEQVETIIRRAIALSVTSDMQESK